MNLKLLSSRPGSILLLAGILVGAASVGSRAHAQAWLPDRAYSEGPGFRAGDLEIHPGVAVRGGYDSNVFRADGKERTAIINNQPTDVTQRIRGAGILAVTPHVYLSTLSEQRQAQGEDRQGAEKPLPLVAFRGGLSTTYFHYFIDGGPKNLEVDTSLWVGILPQRPFNIDVSLNYARNVRPFTQNAGSSTAYNFNTIQPRVRFNFGSRSQVLTSYVGYSPRVTLFESDIFNFLNNTSHGVEAGAGWKFLPNTAVIYDATLDFQRYQKDDPTGTRSPVLYSDSLRFRTRAGLNGALTRTLALRALVGYSAINFSRSVQSERLDDHEDIVGEAMLSWRFGPGQTSSLELGYQRDLMTSALGGWVQTDRGVATLRALLGQVFLLSLEAGAGTVRYGSLWGYDRLASSTNPVPLGANDDLTRKDVRIDGAVRGEFRVTNWLSLMADVSVQTIVTDFQYALYYAQSPVPDPAQYFTVMAFGGVRAHY